ncbi:GUN4 domain-containing protein [Okeanomitos corallinicola TIOX110]|uniref:GUN4 domain-containing protein n=1 Tax=Okeanomitos corallinicola TIOX110 TaxID=3133117 RepID=A0ABZ2US46_9CYAN
MSKEASQQNNENNNITISDQPASQDYLGLTPYVIAMTKFLTNSDTKPPLSISIEGEWGSGKSSFMKQLETEIISESEEIKKRKLQKLWDKIKKEHITSDLSDICQLLEIKFSQKTQTVWFNAWRHEKAESLWATFAISFLEQISSNRDLSDWIPNLLSSLFLFINRLDFKEKPLKSLNSIIYISLVSSIIVTFIYVGVFKVGVSGISQFSEQIVELLETKEEEKEEEKKEKKAQQPKPKPESKEQEQRNDENSDNVLTILLLIGGIGGSSAGIGKLLGKLKEIIGDPKMDLTQYLESPDYKSQVAFVEKFHEDFRKIVEAYIGKDEKVYVFIDDLDRCELDKAADLLQALNMMISNDPQIIFILGMDREKVAAAITYKQKNVLPYLASLNGNNQDQTTNNTNNGLTKKLDYGFSYLEKFVQLSFTIPKPSENSLQGFFTGIYLRDNQDKVSRRKRFFGIPYESIIKTFNKRKSSSNNTTIKVEPETIPPRRELAIFPIIKKDLEYNEQEELVKMVAPFFDNNPRRLKQYLNGLGLKRYIYYYAVGTTWKEREVITQQQLGKFVAITLKYPRLLYELEKEPSLLSTLEKCAVDKDNSSDEKYSQVAYWINTYPKLADLLCYLPNKNNDQPDDKYSLKNQGIKKLLQVLPQQEDLPPQYFQLREFLEENNWKEADQETLNVMLKVANREKEGYLEIEDIENFPCQDLYIIDQLWVKYSEGHFGFSVQKKIYQELGGTIAYDQNIWIQFCDRVGWRKEGESLDYEQLTFTLTPRNSRSTNQNQEPPQGHLPYQVNIWKLTPYPTTGQLFPPTPETRRKLAVVASLFSRIETCKL